MKHLIKAQKIYSQIQSIDKEIKVLETDLKNVIEGDLTTELEYTIKNKPKKEDILDEDGSLVLNQENDNNYFSGFFEAVMNTSKQTGSNSTNKQLNPSEFVVMFAALLKYKQDTRKKLVEDFKKLELKIRL